MDWFEILKGAEEDAEAFYDRTMQGIFSYADASIEEVREALDKNVELEKEAEKAYAKVKGTFMEDVLQPMHERLTRRNKRSKEMLHSYLEDVLTLRDIFQRLDSSISAAPIRQRMMAMRNELTEELEDLIDVEELDKVIADLGFEGREDLR